MILLTLLFFLPLTLSGPICGETELTELSGILNSPNYPDSYDRNTFCIWHISPNVTDDYYITITITDLDIPSKGKTGVCSTDYVKISENSGTTELGKYCNNNKPTSAINSSDKYVSVVFEANYDLDTGTGFSLAWEAKKKANTEA